MSDVLTDVMRAKQMQENLARNSAYAKQGPYQTALPPSQEMQFQQYLKSKPDPRDLGRQDNMDYDMRGWWQGMQANDPRAQLQLAPDGYYHRNDYWKTPYHQSFSAESQWADPAKAPKWNEQDQLVLPDGTVVFDEKRKVK